MRGPFFPIGPGLALGALAALASADISNRGASSYVSRYRQPKVNPNAAKQKAAKRARKRTRRARS